MQAVGSRSTPVMVMGRRESKRFPASSSMRLSALLPVGLVVVLVAEAGAASVGGIQHDVVLAAEPVPVEDVPDTIAKRKLQLQRKHVDLEAKDLAHEKAVLAVEDAELALEEKEQQVKPVNNNVVESDTSSKLTDGGISAVEKKLSDKMQKLFKSLKDSFVQACASLPPHALCSTMFDANSSALVHGSHRHPRDIYRGATSMPAAVAPSEQMLPRRVRRSVIKRTVVPRRRADGSVTR